MDEQPLMAKERHEVQAKVRARLIVGPVTETKRTAGRLRELQILQEDRHRAWECPRLHFLHDR